METNLSIHTQQIEKEVKPAVQVNPGPRHHFSCNKDFHTREEVEKSMEEYPWKVVEPSREKWVSWDALGMKAQNSKNDIKWTNCADMSLGWTGLMVIEQGQEWPVHSHTMPEVYYILQGEPLITLNHTKNRAAKWQCVSIPSNCPHGVIADIGDVVIAWCYLPMQGYGMPRPDKNLNWKFQQNCQNE